ncbi:MAG: cell division protein FtsA [bacterium]|nr:cell division protein FtsA [bacterium]
MQIAGLDIGTHNIKLLVAEQGRKGEIKILKVWRAPSAGVRKGAIYDIDETALATSDMFAMLRKDFKAASKNIYVNVNGPQIGSRSSKGIIAVSRADNEIYKDDIDRVIKASQAISISPNRKIIHTITREFMVDGVKDILDPQGLVGNRLEVESVIVDAFSMYLSNLTRLIELNGCKIGGFVMGPLASSRAVLTKKQKELGVILLDIGAATTGIAVFEEGKLLHSAILPVGAGHITNDVAVGFKMPVLDAETVKLEFGYAVASAIPSKEAIDLHLVNANMKGTVTKRFLSEIIESRLAEIFEFVNNELKAIRKSQQLPAGAVIVGGGAKLRGIEELAREELRLSTRLGFPEASFEIADPNYKAELEDPEFVCAAGLTLCGTEYGKKEGMFDLLDWGNPISSFVKSFFKNLLP